MCCVHARNERRERRARRDFVTLVVFAALAAYGHSWAFAQVCLLLYAVLVATRSPLLVSWLVLFHVAHGAPLSFLELFLTTVGTFVIYCFTRGVLV